MRIVQLANFYGPRSGGLRTALSHLSSGYAARGHEVVRIVPGPSRRTDHLSDGVARMTLAAPLIPGTGGYRVLDPWRVERLLRQLRPDVVEVSDRLTLRRLGAWAARRGVRSVAISHERLDRLLVQAGLPGRLARQLADRANARTAATYDVVVCTTEFSGVEFAGINVHNVVRVPLGVDLSMFAPARRDDRLRASLAALHEPLLVHCGRLSPEKHADRSIDTVRGLNRVGIPARLVVAGDGPRLAALQRRAATLPVTFLGFVDDRDRVRGRKSSRSSPVADNPGRRQPRSPTTPVAHNPGVTSAAPRTRPRRGRPAC